MFHLKKKFFQARKVLWITASVRKQAKGYEISNSFDLIHKNIFCIYIMVAQFKMLSSTNNKTWVR